MVWFRTKRIFSTTFNLIYSNLAYNAQLRGEQRLHPNLKHCAINTKFEVETKMPSVANPS
ncbi:hypothetical protein DXE05_24395 [Vibrio parahaemolyticus]|nr:hypothetical protein DXE05_24395 [Vibrio parahaemolyticus]